MASKLLLTCAVALAFVVACSDSDVEPAGSAPPSLCDGGTCPSSEGGPTSCVDGTKECRADGVYACNAAHVFERSAQCADCASSPEPHCPEACSDGVPVACEGDAIKTCATGALQPCPSGTCVAAGEERVCGTKSGSTTCFATGTDGKPFDLLCADGNAVASNQACNVRSGECAAATFDCSKLTGVKDGEVLCDPSGNFYTKCTAGQPQAILCPAGTKCQPDGTFNCYTEAQAGKSCGGQTVCHPGLHCTQTASNASTCIQPAGTLACTPTDVLAVCNDANTGVACVNGAVWWWKQLTQWGGSCSNNEITLPEGGTCIPGLAHCKRGLACDRSTYDVAGTCRPPAAGAAPACTLTAATSTGRSCIYEWKSCRDGNQYGVSCRAQNVAGQVITICDCLVNGQKTKDFGGDGICAIEKTTDLDAKAAQGCGWNVRTIETALSL